MANVAYYASTIQKLKQQLQRNNIRIKLLQEQNQTLYKYIRGKPNWKLEKEQFLLLYLDNKRMKTDNKRMKTEIQELKNEIQELKKNYNINFPQLKRW